MDFDNYQMKVAKWLGERTLLGEEREKAMAFYSRGVSHMTCAAQLRVNSDSATPCPICEGDGVYLSDEEFGRFVDCICKDGQG